MRFSSPLERATLIRRYKRFLADVTLEDGMQTTVHVANPGAMLGLAEPGMTVWLSRSPSPTRKLPLSWELVDADGGLVGINTHLPNRLVAEALAAEAIPELAGYPKVRPEVRYGEASRVDFLLTAQAGPPCWLEVKSVTLSRERGVAEWPDCRSLRATRHLANLVERVRAGDRAAILFVSQRGDCDRFRIAADLDPAFAMALSEAQARGVEVLAYRCEVSASEIRLSERVRP